MNLVRAIVRVHPAAEGHGGEDPEQVCLYGYMRVCIYIYIYILGGNWYTESLGGLWAPFWVSRVNPRVPDRSCPGP